MRERDWVALQGPPTGPDTDNSLGSMDRLIFLHMEKTGGSAAHEALQSLFPADAFCPERFGQIGEEKPEWLAQYRYFSAHAGLWDFRSVPGRRLFVTFLRDPVDRIVSAYRYWSSIRWSYITSANHELGRRCKSRALIDFLGDDTLARFPFLWNTYAQRLSGEPSATSFIDLWARADELLDRALHNLDRLAAVGITEEFESSFLVLARTFGIENPYDGRRVNLTDNNRFIMPDEHEEANAVNLDHATRAALDRVTHLDRVLYLAAVEKLAAAKARAFQFDCRPTAGARKIERYGEIWFCADNPGIIMIYGPYVRLPRAKFKVSLMVSHQAAPWKRPSKVVGRVELCCGGGSQILLVHEVTIDALRRGRGLIKVCLSLAESVADFEVRFVKLISGETLVRRRVGIELAPGS